METKEFPTVAVLSAVTGRLVSDIGDMCMVLNWMTGEPVFTHQIPRVGREARPVLLKLHPTLAQALEESEQVNPENWEHWRDLWLDRYGPIMTVPKMTADDHERIDPISELAEKMHPDKIIPVVVPGRAPAKAPKR